MLVINIEVDIVYRSVKRECEVTAWSGLTRRVTAALLLAPAMLPGPALAGPPFRTDDPLPVDYQHYELYTFSTGTHVSGDTSGGGPGLEINYGLIPNGQDAWPVYRRGREPFAACSSYSGCLHGLGRSRSSSS